MLSFHLKHEFTIGMENANKPPKTYLKLEYMGSEEVWSILVRLRSIVASNVENLLKLILQTTCTQLLQEWKESATQA